MPLAALCRHPGQATGSPPSLKTDPHQFMRQKHFRLTLGPVYSISGLQLEMGVGSTFIALLSPSPPRGSSDSQGILRYPPPHLWAKKPLDCQDYSSWLCQQFNYLQSFPPSFCHLPHTWKLGCKMREQSKEGGACSFSPGSVGRHFLVHRRPHPWLCARSR